MKLKQLATSREYWANERQVTRSFEHFRFRRVWCPRDGRDCDVVVRVVNGIEVTVRECALRGRGGPPDCVQACLR